MEFLVNLVRIIVLGLENFSDKTFCEFLGEDVVSNATIGDFKTDGGVTVDKDGHARLLVSLSYLENTRRVRQDVVDDKNAKAAAAAAWVRARLPSILISHPGPNIQILGGVMTDRP
ncbi:hypothetical protein LENED_006868 [Lentinula edodes]|uniref:Uncharacterized protein n=1 Tax=Lentinula edodes TaxID=5353 RepID=A0A1Q3ECX2_LENED|nr:hypothetical protein LENED_006868 [Lentinula edodes]